MQWYRAEGERDAVIILRFQIPYTRDEKKSTMQETRN
jgi:hypothetical protein